MHLALAGRYVYSRRIDPSFQAPAGRYMLICCKLRPLVKSDKDFVEDLRAYLQTQSRASLASKQGFLLRNQSRGKGVGLHQNEGFYPDFILWILDDQNQRIVFIEPHGMVHEPIHEDNSKITLFKRLRAISNQRFRCEHVYMDAFIISATDFADLRRRYPNMDKQDFEAWHILFPNSDDLTYLSPIFQETHPEDKQMRSVHK